MELEPTPGNTLRQTFENQVKQNMWNTCCMFWVFGNKINIHMTIFFKLRFECKNVYQNGIKQVFKKQTNFFNSRHTLLQNGSHFSCVVIGKVTYFYVCACMLKERYL
jgi:hypothetical protein